MHVDTKDQALQDIPKRRPPGLLPGVEWPFGVAPKKLSTRDLNRAVRNAMRNFPEAAF